MRVWIDLMNSHRASTTFEAQEAQAGLRVRREQRGLVTLLLSAADS